VTQSSSTTAITHRVLVIGGGGIGERHVRCFLATGRCTVAVAELNPARLAELTSRYRIPGDTDAIAMLDSGVYDCAVIATPAPLHLAQASAAAIRGCHVLIEKPLSLSLQGCAACADLAATNQRVLAVGYVYRANPVLRQFREFVIQSNGLEQIRQLTINAGQPFDLYRPDYARTYYAKPEMGGGAIQDAVTHLLDLIAWFLGPPSLVSAQSAHLVLSGVNVEDTVHLFSRHQHALACLSLNQFQAANELTVTLNTPDSLFRVEPHLQRFGRYTRQNGEWEWHQQPMVDRDTPFIDQAHGFLDAVEGRGEPLCTFSAGLSALRFQLATLASHKDQSRSINPADIE
jgi:predicted dehydrogenase